MLACSLVQALRRAEQVAVACFSGSFHAGAAHVHRPKWAADIGLAPDKAQTLRSEIRRNVATPASRAHRARANAFELYAPVSCDRMEGAASNQEWEHVYCAAIVAANTSMRPVEVKHLRRCDVDLVKKLVHVRRSKNEPSHRVIPLNTTRAEERSGLGMNSRIRCFGESTSGMT